MMINKRLYSYPRCDFILWLGQSPLTPTRFVHNLTGMDKEVLLWTADEIKKSLRRLKIILTSGVWLTIRERK